jgi:hypothetical protein
MTSRSLLVASAALLLCAAPRLAAQTATGTVSAGAGLTVYGTGDDANCGTLPALTVGVRARTGGTWFMAGSADLSETAPNFACTSMLSIVHLGDDRFAEEHGGAWFTLTPRLALHAGRVVEAGRWQLEPSVGGGALVAREMFSEGRGVHPWAGGALQAGRAGSRLALHAEAGAHGVPLRHEIYRHADLVPPIYEGRREFRRWRPLTQVALRVRL